MKSKIKTTLILSGLYIVVFWLFIPALECRYWGRTSLVRLDPLVSKDYDCVFVEGHSSKKFDVPWLSRHTPLDYIRIRYTPNSDGQQYGIMFIDPLSLAYEAHDCCVLDPVQLSGKLDSSVPISNWINSQPHAISSDEHANDAREILAVIHSLASCDLEHFTLSKDLPLRNFKIGFQRTAPHGGPSLAVSLAFLLMISITTFSRKKNSGYRLKTSSRLRGFYQSS